MVRPHWWCTALCVRYGPGGVLPSTMYYEGMELYTYYQVESRVRSQERAEKMRYIRDNGGSLVGYKPRFAHGSSLALLLRGRYVEIAEKMVGNTLVAIVMIFAPKSTYTNTYSLSI